MPEIGEMRHRVSILAPVSVSDADYGPTVSYVVGDTAWAYVMNTGGTEFLYRKGVQAQGSHVVYMRYRKDLTTRHRLQWEGKILEIVNLSDLDGRKRFHAVTCKEYPVSPS